MNIEGPNKGTHGLDIPQGVAQTERARLNLVTKCGVKQWKQN